MKCNFKENKAVSTANSSSTTDVTHKILNNPAENPPTIMNKEPVSFEEKFKVYL